eukprot:1253770-Pleurochrysis_carterae.AAC.1
MPEEEAAALKASLRLRRFQSASSAETERSPRAALPLETERAARINLMPQAFSFDLASAPCTRPTRA